MANRKDLSTIRDARAGQADAQLALGKRYLSGAGCLPRNLASALHWLDRAAQQGREEAWLLIGRHIPHEVASRSTRMPQVARWYEKAFEAGVTEAGFIMARLVLAQPGADAELHARAMAILEQVAQSGAAEAQWLLACQLGRYDAGALKPGRRREDSIGPAGLIRFSGNGDNGRLLDWVRRAAQNGVPQAQFAMAEHAWQAADQAAFLQWGLPLARRIAVQLDSLRQTLHAGSAPHRAFRSAEVSLLSRCAQSLMEAGQLAAGEIGQFWEFAALAGDRIAQYSLGLWFARMDGMGRRVAAIPGVANYKKSVRWLLLAAGQGMAEAWYALSRIYAKPECSQRDPGEALRYLARAAHAGHGAAQLEMARHAWRGRGARDGGVEAVYWLQKAAAQGDAEARAMLDKLSVPVAPAPWAQAALRCFPPEAVDLYPRLLARVELAASLGLTRTECLLIDPKAADCGHCLRIDIRAMHPHGKMRLIRLQDAQERRMLDRLLSRFEQTDPGQEGNYRQRLYRLKVLTGKTAGRQTSIVPSNTVTAGPVR